MWKCTKHSRNTKRTEKTCLPHSLAVVAPRLPEGLQDPQGDADVAE